MPSDAAIREFGPWSPGISSRLPREYLPMSTMLRPENVSTGLDEARELSDMCGLAPHELVAFRAERLLVHELLIRVTADLTVPDGPNYEDLGISFREIAANILSGYIAPHVAEISRLHNELNRDASERIERELSDLPPSRPGPAMSVEEKTLAALAFWAEKSKHAETSFEKACFDALIRIVGAIARKRGRLVGDMALIARLAATQVCNSHGSERIGDAIDPYIRQAAAREGRAGGDGPEGPRSRVCRGSLSSAYRSGQDHTLGAWGE